MISVAAVNMTPSAEEMATTSCWAMMGTMSSKAELARTAWKAETVPTS